MPNFKKAAAAARKRGDSVTAKRIATEGRIVRALVQAALAEGYRVTVFDSEEYTLYSCRDFPKIMVALFTTDEDTIVLTDKDGKRAGSFYLVYGNEGPDVISDYSVSREDIYQKVLPIIEKAEAER